jgi:hypothetical protein
MLKTASDRAEEILNSPPSRSEESVATYVERLKQASRDLRAELNDPRTRMGDRDYVKISNLLSEIEGDQYNEGRLLQAESILEAIRNELPSQEMVEDDGMGAIDVRASVEKLAVAVAYETQGRDNFARMAHGLQTYQTDIEPLIPPELQEFPRQKFAERLAELLAMPNTRLAEEVKKTFPTKEWIGPDPEPVGGEGDLGYIPSHFEKDPNAMPSPESKDSDGEFEKAIEKERKFRGIEKAEGNAGSKVADATNATPGSHEPASSSDGGAAMQAKPPEPEDAFENKIEQEANKSTGAPRGPNRRTQKDVPAYSTPKEKLTAAAKLAEQYENMTELEALQIVMAATDEDVADDVAEGRGEEDEDTHQVEKNASYNDLEGLFDV